MTEQIKDALQELCEQADKAKRGKFFVVGEFASYEPTEYEIKSHPLHSTVRGKRMVAEMLKATLSLSCELIGREPGANEDLRRLIARLLREADETEEYVIEGVKGGKYVEAEQKAMYAAMSPEEKAMSDRAWEKAKAFWASPEGQPEYLREQERLLGEASDLERSCEPLHRPIPGLE